MSTLHRTFLNYKETRIIGEINTMPSETQPDMTLSLAELIERHVRGLEIPQFVGQYQDISDETTYGHDMDLSEIYQLQQLNQQRIKELTERSRAPESEPPIPIPKQPTNEVSSSGEADKPQKSEGQK